MKIAVIALSTLLLATASAQAEPTRACLPAPQGVRAIPSIPPDPGIPPQEEIPAPPAAIVPSPDMLRLELPALPTPEQLRRQEPAFPGPRRLMRERPAIPPPALLRQQRPAITLPRKQARPQPTRTQAVVLQGDEAQVVLLLNNTRRAQGLRSLRIDPRATEVARAHSADMCRRRFFDHRNPEGLAPWHRLKVGGVRFSAAAENIAVGYRSASSVHDGWMRSVGHRKNRMESSYRRIGVGKVVCGSTIYWTEVFMR